MNRITILLNTVPNTARCAEIADILSVEHFGTDAQDWNLTTTVPEDTPLHLKDQFVAEIRGRQIENPHYLVILGEEK